MYNYSNLILLSTCFFLFLSVCCRSPIVPVRPTYSAELLSTSFNGSLPRSAGASGSAPDLSQHQQGRHISSASPVTNVWTNPLNVTSSSSSSATYSASTNQIQAPSSASANQHHPYHHQHQHHSHQLVLQHEPVGLQLQQQPQQNNFNGTSVSVWFGLLLVYGTFLPFSGNTTCGVIFKKMGCRKLACCTFFVSSSLVVKTFFEQWLIPFTLANSIWSAIELCFGNVFMGNSCH